MGRKPDGGVRPASATSIEIDFHYRGVRCRERIHLPPTLRNLEDARNRLGRIKDAIRLERETRGQVMFDYAAEFPDSARARRFARESRTEGQLITVKCALRAWLTDAERRLQRSTLIDYRKSIEGQIIPALGDKKLSELTRRDVREWTRTLTASPKRIANILTPLRAMLDDAADDDEIGLERNPLDGWKPRRKETRTEEDDVDPFKPEEIAAIVNALPDQAANMIQFAFWTGLRTSEFIALKWGDIDWRQEVVSVRRAKVRGEVKPPKTKAGRREVKLLLPALEALRRQKPFNYIAGQEVFHNPRTGEPWAGDAPIRKTAWTPALRRAKVRYRRPYQTRHTYASMMLSAGENPVWVAHQMGHKDWTMIARVYGRWIPEADPDAGSRIMKKMAGWSVSSQSAYLSS